MPHPDSGDWQGMFERVPSLVFAFVAALSLLFSIFLLIYPYYYLGRDQYITKSNPSAGYFMHRSSEAWFFLILALVLLAVFFIAIGFYVKRLQDEGSGWVTPRF